LYIITWTKIHRLHTSENYFISLPFLNLYIGLKLMNALG